MKFVQPRNAAFAIAASLIAVGAMAAEPKSGDEHDATQERSDEDKGTKEAPAIVIPAIKEEKRICRRVKLDMSSRRASKVCKTAEEWREFNQRR